MVSRKISILLIGVFSVVGLSFFSNVPRVVAEPAEENPASVKSADPKNVSIGGSDVGILKVDSGTIVTNTLNAVYAISAVVAVIAIVAGGIMYVISDGDPGRISTAKNAIIYSLVGLVIIGSAFIITGVVQTIGK